MPDKILIIKIFFQGVPEAAAVLFACLAMVGYKIKLKKLLLLSVTITILIHILRMIPLPFGVHTIFGIVICTMIIYKLAEVSLVLSFLTVFTISFILALIEFGMLKLLNFLLGYQLTYQPSNGDWLWIISGWPQIIIMFILGHCIHRYFRPCYFTCFRK